MDAPAPLLAAAAGGSPSDNTAPSSSLAAPPVVEKQPPATPEPAVAPDAKPAPEVRSAGPLSLWVNFSRVLVAGHASTLEVRVRSEEGDVENLELGFESRGFDGQAITRMRRLAGGEDARVIVEIDPARAGNFVLQVSARWDAGGQRFAYRGQRPLRINQPPDNANIVINISDIQSNTGSGANAGLGAEYGDVHISNLLGANSIKTLNDLLDLELPEKFHLVPLVLDYELSMVAVRQSAGGAATSLEIPAALTGTANPGASCVLEPADGVELPWPLRLMARPVFKLGRARADADFVAWVLPRSPANDERTLRVSKVHATLEVRDGSVVVRDGGSANGTFLDGQKVGADGTAIASRAKLTLGAVVDVEVTRFAAAYGEVLPIRNLRQWHGPQAAAHPVRGAYRCEVMAEAPQPVNAVWLLSEGAFGTSRSNALVFAWPGVAEIHGRFHFFRGCFWVEALAGGGAIKVDQTALRPGEIAPLATGQRLEIGSRPFRATIGA